MINIVLDRVDKRQYATFKDVPAMRSSVNKHIKTIQESGLSDMWKRKLICLLDQLRDLSQQFPGLSFSSQRKLATKLGLKKRDTVGIWLKKLADMGIVNILPAKRYYKNQQTVNFVQILPATTKAETEPKGDKNKKRALDDIQKLYGDADVKTKNGQHDFKNYLISKTNINITYSRLDETFTPKNVPESFIKTVKPFFGQADEIYDLWGKAKLAFNKFKLSHLLVDYVDLVEDAFKQTVFAYKHGKIKKDFIGYFYGALMRMFTYKKRKETFADHPIIFNWLDDYDSEEIPY